MKPQTYLIDTNILVGLEDNKEIDPAYAALSSSAASYGVKIFVHAAAKDDIARDVDVVRRGISLSKIEKFPVLEKVRNLDDDQLRQTYGPLNKPNDVVDATLLHAVENGAVDFLVSEDKGLHKRARRRSSELGRRVLYLADAVELLKATYEPKESHVRYVEEVSAHTLQTSEPFFQSLRADYPGFDAWWKTKCAREHRKCWIIDDGGIAALVVRKDESEEESPDNAPVQRVLKICTFKVLPARRGVKLGELLLKKILWFAQENKYDLVYLTVYEKQEALIDLIEYFGFLHTRSLKDGEKVYEKRLSRDELVVPDGTDAYEACRLQYPRFARREGIRAFGVPIKEEYHDTLYPDLRLTRQLDIFEESDIGAGPRTPGNTIRKVYLCRAQSNLAAPGSILFFYKGRSDNDPSQAITALGVLEEVAQARSPEELLRLAGSRSVYSSAELKSFAPTKKKPIKVINYLLMNYVKPSIGKDFLFEAGVFHGSPPQSIFEIQGTSLDLLLSEIHFNFEI